MVNVTLCKVGFSMSFIIRPPSVIAPPVTDLQERDNVAPDYVL
jgi:hypothetical protein